MEQVVSTFSQRMGYRPVREIQLNSIDTRLGNELWNLIYTDVICYFNDNDNTDMMDLFWRELWVEFSELPIHEFPGDWSGRFAFLEELYFSSEWYRIYDLLEFLLGILAFAEEWGLIETFRDGFVNRCNDVLKRNLSGYRLVGNKVVPVTSDQEITAVEEALNLPASLAPVSLHLKTALDRLADKPEPDYRNSIKESISAVESLCALLAGKKTELKPALREIEKQGVVHFHPALKEGFEKLYGYTSNAGGIRHALIDEPNLDVEDAVYMLVTCSAFTNYLLRKAEKAGVQF